VDLPSRLAWNYMIIDVMNVINIPRFKDSELLQSQKYDFLYPGEGSCFAGYGLYGEATQSAQLPLFASPCV
jgi:fructose-1,6-bisphosphatase